MSPPSDTNDEEQDVVVHAPLDETIFNSDKERCSAFCTVLVDQGFIPEVETFCNVVIAIAYEKYLHTIPNPPTVT